MSRTMWSPRQTVFLPVTVFPDRGPFLSLISFSLHHESSSSSPQVTVPSPHSQQFTAVSPYFRLRATSLRRDHEAVIKTLASPRLPSVDGSSGAPLSPRRHTAAPSPEVSLFVSSPSTVPFVLSSLPVSQSLSLSLFSVSTIAASIPVPMTPTPPRCPPWWFPTVSFANLLCLLSVIPLFLSPSQVRRGHEVIVLFPCSLSLSMNTLPNFSHFLFSF